MTNSKVRVGIVGSAGYTAGELIRLLVHHPRVTVEFAYSTSNASNSLYKVHQDLIGDTDLVFSKDIQLDVDVVFLCLGHGNSKAFLEKNHFSKDTVIIDLSNDFRLSKDSNFQGKGFVYGLPEFQKEVISKAQYIANPGCFATAIQLGLLPLAKANLLKQAVHIQAVTGSTGAGVSLSPTSHFSWRESNFSYYKPFKHQHLSEIGQTLSSLQKEEVSDLFFMPYRGNFTRGIFATMYTPYGGTLEQAKTLYKEYYQNSLFTFLSDEPLHLKQVVNTNKCLVHLHLDKGMLLITSCIDNLIKGASGQAIENMNLICGFEPSQGLKLKASYF